MLRAGIAFIIIAAAAAATAWALARMNRDIDTAFGDVPWLHPEMLGVKAAANSSAGGSNSGRRPSVTNANQQTTHSNSPIKSGRGGL